MCLCLVQRQVTDTTLCKADRCKRWQNVLGRKALHCPNT